MRRRFRGQVIKGHLDLLLLAVVADGPLHGYAIIDRLNARSDGAIDLPEGTVYPALHRLEERGLLASAWSTASGRRRKEYEITARGRTTLSSEREQWVDFATTVNGVIGGIAWNPT